MILTEITYLAQKERYADLYREAEYERLVKAAGGHQQRQLRERWYARYLFSFFLAMGMR